MSSSTSIQAKQQNDFVTMFRSAIFLLFPTQNFDKTTDADLHHKRHRPGSAWRWQPSGTALCSLVEADRRFRGAYSTRLHSAMSQKALIFIFADVRTWNLTQHLLSRLPKTPTTGQDGQSPGLVYNRGSPEYEAVMPTTRPFITTGADPHPAQFL
jgi:hypothetical protein